MIHALSVGKRRGVTLLEILITVFLFSLATLMMITLLKKGLESYNEGRAFIALQQDCRRAIDIVASEIREADGSGGSTMQLGTCTLFSSSCTPCSAPQSSISFTKVDPFRRCGAALGGKEPVTFDLQGTQIRRQTCGGAEQTLLTSSDLEVVTFSFTGQCMGPPSSLSPVVTITVSAQKKMKALVTGQPRLLKFSVQTDVAPRFREQVTNP